MRKARETVKERQRKEDTVYKELCKSLTERYVRGLDGYDRYEPVVTDYNEEDPFLDKIKLNSKKWRDLPEGNL